MVEGSLGTDRGMGGRVGLECRLSGLARVVVRFAGWSAGVVAATLRNASWGFLGPNRTNREQLEQRKGPLLALIDYLRLKYAANSAAMISLASGSVAIGLRRS